MSQSASEIEVVGVCFREGERASLEDHTRVRSRKALNGKVKRSKATFKELGLYFEEGLTDFEKSVG